MPKRTHDGLKKRCGCPRRQWAKCAHPWWFSFCHDRQQYRFSLALFATTKDGSMSKTEAETLRATLRAECRAGERTPSGQRVGTVDPTAPLTVGDVCDHYVTRHIDTPGRRDGAKHKLRLLVAQLRHTEVPGPQGTRVRLEALPITALTKAHVEAVRDARRAVAAEARAAAAEVARLEALNATRTAEQRVPVPADLRRLAGIATRSGKGGEAGLNRLVARFRHLCNWAVAEGHLAESPFRRAGVPVVHLTTKVEGPRTRRLQPGEEEALLRHAGPHLRALIIAALSTGCRVGELLSLQWAQVRLDATGQPKALELLSDKTKTGEPRVIPVGGRLRAVLAMRRTGPDGEDLPPDGYVFGNEVGERVGSVKTAWRKTLRRAGITDLHFHDLRREFASRLLESRAELHDVQAFLGHAAITTTSRYLRSTPLRLEQALARLEGREASSDMHDRSDTHDRTPSTAEAPAAPPSVN